MNRKIDEAYRVGREQGYKEGYIEGRQEIMDMIHKEGLAINNDLYNPQYRVIVTDNKNFEEDLCISKKFYKKVRDR